MEGIKEKDEFSSVKLPLINVNGTSELQQFALEMENLILTAKQKNRYIRFEICALNINNGIIEYKIYPEEYSICTSCE